MQAIMEKNSLFANTNVRQYLQNRLQKKNILYSTTNHKILQFTNKLDDEQIQKALLFMVLCL